MIPRHPRRLVTVAEHPRHPRRLVTVAEHPRPVMVEAERLHREIPTLAANQDSRVNQVSPVTRMVPKVRDRVNQVSPVTRMVPKAQDRVNQVRPAGRMVPKGQHRVSPAGRVRMN